MAVRPLTRVAASGCKLQTKFGYLVLDFFFLNNCDIWAFWNVNVSKKDAKVYSSLK